MKNTLFFIVLYLFFSCGSTGLDINERDPNPLSSILFIETINGDTLNTADSLNTDEIVINWSGNEFSFEYQYTLEYLTPAPGDFAIKSTSDWIKDQSGVMSHLDDGEYRFVIRSRYDADHEETGGDSILFIINAVTGPALRFYPLHQAISAGSNVDLYLYIEDVQDLIGMELNISYAPETLSILQQTVMPTGLLTGSSTFYVEFDQGLIRIIAGGNNFSEIDGTGEVVQLTFQTSAEMSGQAEVSILETTKLRDSGNDVIIILGMENGLIEVISD